MAKKSKAVTKEKTCPRCGYNKANADERVFHSAQEIMEHFIPGYKKQQEEREEERRRTVIL